MNDDKTYTLKELAEVSGYSARTIRYYISQGLLESPTQGRSAEYNQGHFDRLGRIKELQTEGMSLQQVRDALVGPPPMKIVPFGIWQEFRTSKYSKVSIRVDASPQHKHQLLKATELFIQAVADPEPQVLADDDEEKE